MKTYVNKDQYEKESYEDCLTYYSNKTFCSIRKNSLVERSIETQSKILYLAFLKYTDLSKKLRLMSEEKTLLNALRKIGYGDKNFNVNEEDKILLDGYDKYLIFYNLKIQVKYKFKHKEIIAFDTTTILRENVKPTSYLNLFGLTLLGILASYAIFSRKTF